MQQSTSCTCSRSFSAKKSAQAHTAPSGLDAPATVAAATVDVPVRALAKAPPASAAVDAATSAAGWKALADQIRSMCTGSLWREEPTKASTGICDHTREKNVKTLKLKSAPRR